MSSPVWDDTEKKKLRELVGLVLAFVVGSVFFLPSLSAIIQPPYVGKLVLLLFLCFSWLAIIFLCLALYLTFTGGSKPPHISHGIGNIFAVLSFISISIYLISNIYSSIDTSPTINDISFSPVNPAAGTSVLFKGSATDKDNDVLKYTWMVNGKTISSESFAYYFVDKSLSCIKVVLKVEDPSGNSAISTVNINVDR